MFYFEKLIVYKKAKEYNKEVLNYLDSADIDKLTYDQVHRVSFSIMLNMAEETGMFTKRDCSLPQWSL